MEEGILKPDNGHPDDFFNHECILLEPSDPAVHRRVLDFQSRCREHWGGTVMEQQHITIQKFLSPGVPQMERVTDRTRSIISRYSPIEISIRRLMPMYSGYRGFHILKGVGESPDRLEALRDELDELLANEFGLELQYDRSGVFACTLLEDVNQELANEPVRELGEPIRIPLDRLLYSNIRGPNRYRQGVPLAFGSATGDVHGV